MGRLPDFVRPHAIQARGETSITELRNQACGRFPLPMTEKWGQGEGKSFRQLKLQTPNSKLQRSSKSQAPRQRACDRYWNLKFGISLELGVWDLVFHYLNTPWLRPGSDFFSCLSHVSRLL